MRKTQNDSNHARTKFGTALAARRQRNDSAIKSGNTVERGNSSDSRNARSDDDANGKSLRVSEQEFRNARNTDGGSGSDSGGSGRAAGRVGSRSGNGSRRNSGNRSAESDAERIANRVEELVREDNAVDADVQIALEEQQPKQRRKRRTKAEMNRDSEKLESGVTASAMLLGGLIQTLSETAAMSFNNKLYRLNSGESNELGSALLDCLNTLPKAARKRFDRIFQQYYPFWNLAVVATKIVYPRYQFAKIQKEVEAQNVREGQESDTEES